MTNIVCRPNRRSALGGFDSLFDEFFNFPTRPAETRTGFAPRTDIAETDDEITLTFEIPGMEKDDIKVSVANDLITVSGKRESKSEDKNDGYVRREIRAGEFSRSFTLPDTVNRENVSADYKNGLLVVKLGKLEEVKPKEIEVTVK